MEKVQRTLMTAFWLPVVVAITLVVLGETDILPVGVLADDKGAEFVVLSIMELLTICAIPVALRLFKFAFVANRLKSEAKICHLKRFGLARIAMLCAPLLANVVFYYAFMHVGFAYMSIILALSLFFVYPSLSRCYDETGSNYS